MTINSYNHLTNEDIDYILSINLRRLNRVLKEAESPEIDSSNSSLSAIRAGVSVIALKEETDKLVTNVIKAVEGGSIYCNHDFTAKICNHCGGKDTLPVREEDL